MNVYATQLRRVQGAEFRRHLVEKDSDGSEAWGGMPRGEPSLSVWLQHTLCQIPNVDTSAAAAPLNESVRVRLTTQDGERSVELLGEDDPSEPVRQGELRK